MISYTISIDGQNISYVRTHRFLAVIIDRDLCWSPYVAYLKEKASDSYLLSVQVSRRKNLMFFSTRDDTTVQHALSRIYEVQLTSADEYLQN